MITMFVLVDSQDRFEFAFKVKGEQESDEALIVTLPGLRLSKMRKISTNTISEDERRKINIPDVLLNMTLGYKEVNDAQGYFEAINELREWR